MTLCLSTPSPTVMTDDIAELPVTEITSCRDDEMDDSMYSHPPGLMPSISTVYDEVRRGDTVTIYEVDSAGETYIKSDIHFPVIR